MKTLFCLTLAAAVWVVLPCVAQPTRADVLVLDGVTLIDGTGSPPMENAQIVIQGGRILKVGRSGSQRPKGATVLPVNGRFVMPGFIDTHVHSSALADFSKVLLAFGITTIRSPGNQNSVEMRRRLRSGDLLGPALAAGGRIIDHPLNQLPGTRIKVQTETEIREAIQQQAALGVDCVKLYMGITPALLRAAIHEAHAHGIRVIGHLHCTSWTEAAEAGIDALVHSGSEGPSWELLDAPNARERFSCGDFGIYLKAWASSAAAVDLRGARMERLIRALIENRVEVNPTLVVIESLYWGDDPRTGQRLEPSYAPPSLKKRWGDKWEDANPFMRQWSLTSDEWNRVKKAFVNTKDMIRLFHERGVLLTAGSDVEMPWITPGVSFHRELELLVSSGISPAGVLKIATQNGARALGIHGEVGTLAEGKRADLVVLREDPLQDIRNTRSIEMVIANGQVYRPESLLR